MLSSKALRLNQKINTGDTEKNCGTPKSMGQGGRGNEENQVQSKKQRSDNSNNKKSVIKT